MPHSAERFIVRALVHRTGQGVFALMRLKKWIPYFLSCLPVAALIVFLAFAGSKAVTVMAENAPPKDRHTIIIDAGHGGEDGGAISCTGVSESAFNLEISLRLNDLLHLLGYDTLLIRNSDISVYTQGQTIAAKKVSDLKERVRIVNATQNALLISIHQNHFADSRYSGAQVFYAPTEGSEALAKSMQDAFVQTINLGSNRKSKKSTGVYLMEHIRCAAVLVECGFLSNPAEEAKLRTADYQKQVCGVIAAVVGNYLPQ